MIRYRPYKNLKRKEKKKKKKQKRTRRKELHLYPKPLKYSPLVAQHHSIF